jgi:hypothetical protein
VSEERPGAIPELEVVDALQNQKVLVTNGPFVRMGVTGEGPCARLLRRREPEACAGRPPVCSEPLERRRCQLGEMARAGTDGQVQLDLDVQAASWVDVDTIRVWQNGRIVDSLSGARDAILGEHARVLTATTGDAWVVVEVTGSVSMFPVITPIEIEPIQVADAVDAIGSGFGFELNPFGNLQPQIVTPAFPYAITNPVFIDADGDGVFSPPGVAASAIEAATAPRTSAQRPTKEDVPVLIRMFSLFSRHAH